jgi:hypothetical protein
MAKLISGKTDAQVKVLSFVDYMTVKVDLTTDFSKIATLLRFLAEAAKVLCHLVQSACPLIGFAKVRCRSLTRTAFLPIPPPASVALPPPILRNASAARWAGTREKWVCFQNLYRL